MRLGDAMRIAAAWPVGKPPRLTIPNAVLRLGRGCSPHGGAMLGVASNLARDRQRRRRRHVLGLDAKAVAELGFAPRSLEVGLRDAFEGG